MKKLFYLILALAFCVSCESGGDDAKTSKDANLATVEEQMSAISQSLPKIKAAVAALKDVVEGAEPSASAVTRGNNDEDKIHGVKEYIAALEERIAALENYIAEGGEYSDWLETTFATLEMYEETISILATVQAEVESLKEQMSASNKALLDKADSKIEAAIGSMKDWVCDKLSGYYDIAATDALLAQLEATISDSDTELRAEIESLRNGLRESLAEMKSDYEDAIAKAINDNNGVLTSLLQKEISNINNRIDDEIDTLNKRLDDIEKRLEELEKVVADLIKRIQSITYLPIYEDEAARVECPNADMTDSRLQLDFMISPKEGVADLAKAYKNVISVSAFYPGSTDFVDLPVISCSAKPEQGILTVVAAGDNLSMDFYRQKKSCKVFMSISDGNNDRNSEYVSITPVYKSTEATNSQITYTTNNNRQLSLSRTGGFGASLLAHYYRDGLGVMVFDGDVKSIGDSAFKNCNSLTGITIPESVTSIGREAFYNSGLTSISIPDGVSSIGERAFFECLSMKEYSGKFASGDSRCLIIDGELIAFAPVDVTSYVIPEDVVTIGSYVFSGCTSLTSITIPDSVTEIGNEAFRDCTGELIINSKIVEIDYSSQKYPYSTWLNGTKFTKLVIGDNIDSIGNRVFYRCTSLTSVAISESVTSIKEHSFYDTSGLKEIVFESITPPMLGENAFTSSSRVDSPTIYVPNEGYANYICSNWPIEYKSWIASGINEWPANCIIKYTTLDNSIINFNSWGDIKSNTYENGEGIICFWEPIASIGEGAFYNCNSLTSVTIPDSVTTIGGSAFESCDHLTSIAIPDSVTEIGMTAFFNCGSLTSIAIPDSVTTIGFATFASCSSLTSITIPDSVTAIGEVAFFNCTSLKVVYCKAAIPPTGDASMFDENASGRKIYVPRNSVEAYKSATYWSEYADYVVGYDFE